MRSSIISLSRAAAARTSRKRPRSRAHRKRDALSILPPPSPPATFAASTGQSNNSTISSVIDALPPLSVDGDTSSNNDDPTTKSCDFGHMPEFLSLIKSSRAPTGDEALLEAAQHLQSIIQNTPFNERDQIIPRFIQNHPAKHKIIKEHGGIKAVSRLLPHIYTFERSGRLTVPPPGETRDELKLLAQNTRSITLCDAFLLVYGGTTANMKGFEQDYCDEEGNCRLKAVAVDVEGTHLVPPLLIQVCPIQIESFEPSKKVYLEQPRRQSSYTGGSQLSEPLKDLLADPSVLKVFFDVKGDISSLGVPVHNTLCLQKELSLATSRRSGRKLLPSLLDAFNECGTNDKVLNGRSQYRYLYTKNKTLQKWFGDQKRPSKRIHDKLLWYGAADAWATATIYQNMMQKTMEGSKEEKIANGQIDSSSGGRPLTTDEIRAELERRAAALAAKRASGGNGKYDADKVTDDSDGTVPSWRLGGKFGNLVKGMLKIFKGS